MSNYDKQYQREYYIKNKNKLILRKKERYLNNYKSTKKTYSAEELILKKEHERSRICAYQRKYRKEYKYSLFELLGNKCARCSFSNPHALQIDHINGGGSNERKNVSGGATFYKNVFKSIENKEDKYQLLCANCNWIKRVENKELNCY